MNTKKDTSGELRHLLNDFLMDVDNEAQLGAKVANAIVSVHQRKFQNLFDSAIKEAEERAIQATREETVKEIKIMNNNELKYQLSRGYEENSRLAGYASGVVARFLDSLTNKSEK